MEEKRIERLGVCMKTFADVDRHVLPIVGKCLDGMTKAAESIEPKTVSICLHTHHHMGYIIHSTQGVSVITHTLPIRLSFTVSNKNASRFALLGGGGFLKIK